MNLCQVLTRHEGKLVGRSQVQGSTFRVKDKEGIADPNPDKPE